MRATGADGGGLAPAAGPSRDGAEDGPVHAFMRRLYYLRRMNAWTAPSSAPSSSPRPAAGAKPRRPAPGYSHYPIRRRPATACATPSSAVSPTSATSIQIRHLPRVFRRAGLEVLLFGRLSPQARAVVRTRARARYPVAGRAPRREADRSRAARGAPCAGCSRSRWNGNFTSWARWRWATTIARSAA